MNTFLYKEVPLVNLCPVNEDPQDKWIHNFTHYVSIKAVEYNVASGWNDAVDPLQPVAIHSLRFLRDHGAKCLPSTRNEDGLEDGLKRENGNVCEYFIMQFWI